MQLFFRKTTSGVRVWRSDWYNDQFELLSFGEFETLCELGKRFGISIDEAEED